MTAAVTFDFWHTLAYLEPTAEEHYVRRQTEMAVDAILAGNPLTADRRPSPARARAAFDRERRRAVRRATLGSSVTVDEQFCRAAWGTGRSARVDVYLAMMRRELASTRFRVAPGAQTVLERLRRSGYRVGLVSNTVGEPGAYLRPVLRRLGLERLMDTCVFSDETPWTKPSPRIFRAALRQLGSTPGRALHVGDGWADIEGARRAGLRAGVLFTGLRNYAPSYRRLFAPPGADARAGFRIEHLEELPALVERILPVRRR